MAQKKNVTIENGQLCIDILSLENECNSESKDNVKFYDEKHHIKQGTRFCIQCNRLIGYKRFGLILFTSDDAMISMMDVDVYERLKEIRLASLDNCYLAITLDQWNKIEKSLIDMLSLESECVSEPKTNNKIKLNNEKNNEIFLTEKEAYKFYRFISKKGDNPNKLHINSIVASAIINTRKLDQISKDFIL